MRPRRNLKSRALASVLAICMVLSLLPSAAFATDTDAQQPDGGLAVGSIENVVSAALGGEAAGGEFSTLATDGPYTEAAEGAVPATGVKSRDDGGFRILENEYIRLYAVDDGSAISIVPATEGVPGIVQVPSFSFIGNFRQKNGAGFLYGPTVTNRLEARPASTSSFWTTADGNRVLCVDYRFSEEYTSIYGEHKGHTFFLRLEYQLMRLPDTPEHTRNYGVQVKEYVRRTALTGEIPVDIVSGPSGWVPTDPEFRVEFTCTRFPVMGHVQYAATADAAATQYVTRSGASMENTTYTNISNSNLGETKTSGYDSVIVEVVGDGYSWGTPFVSLANTTSSGKQYPDLFRYNNKTQTLGVSHIVDTDEINARYFLFGFRDLIDSEKEPTPPDVVTIPTTASRLAIFSDGKGGYVAERAVDDRGVTNLRSQYGSNPVAVLRGELEETGGQFVFTKGAVALSSTVTATWDASKGGYLRVSKDGKISQNGVSLNAPSFKFYSPKLGREASLTLAFEKKEFENEDSKQLLTMTFVPEDNAAIVNTDIPYSITRLEGAWADADGNLSLAGLLRITTVLNGASFTLEELGFGPKTTNGKTEFKIFGVNASGELDTAAMFGLDLAKVKGSINTFPDRTKYKFELELNVFELFKAKADLELKRFDATGHLMPNNLYFYLGSDLVGVPLIPPVTVATLKGVGGGFEGLADTFNGNYFAIPPLRLSATGTVSALNVVDATATLKLGPLYVQKSLTDIQVAGTGKLKVFKEFTQYYGAEGQVRSYNGVEYKGLQLIGGVGMEADFPSVEDKQNWIIVKGEINFGAFAGLDSYSSPTRLYLLAGGNGRIGGTLQFPSKFPIEKLRDRPIVGAELQTALGVETVVVVNSDWRNAWESLYKNADIYLGVVGQVDSVAGGIRVWYVRPPGGGYELDYELRSLFRGFDDWDWSKHNIPTFGGASVLSVGSEAETEASFLPMGASPQTVDFLAGGSTADDSLHIFIQPDNTMTDAEFETFIASLAITGPGGSLPLSYLENLGDAPTLAEVEAANATAGVTADGDRGILVRVGQGGSDQSFTVTANSDFTAKDYVGQAFASFEASLSGAGLLTGQVKNPETGTVYVLRTYLSTEQGGTDYLIDQSTVTDPSAISYQVPTSGAAVPTGNYYVSSYLMEEVRKDYNEDGTTSDEEVGYLTVGSEEFAAPISYTNTFEPAVPASVTIAALGNETMGAQWDEVADADGYKVVIYQEDGPGNWVDTTAGYQFDVADFAATQGISYDAASGTYLMDMALTVGDENLTLDANNTYRIGVSAYKYLSDTDDDGTSDSYPAFGGEGLSNAEYLPEYVALDLELYNASDPSSPVLLSPDPSTGVYALSVGDASNFYLGVSDAGPSASDYSVERMDTGAALSATGYSSPTSFSIPSDFEGSMLLRVTGVYDHGSGVFDSSERFVLVSHDNTVPLLSLDDDIYRGNPETGAYTITGVTEPGALVKSDGIYDADDNPVDPVPAGVDGTFAISGVLDTASASVAEDGTVAIDGYAGKLLELTATDPTGNLSDVAFAMVSAVPWSTDATLAGLELSAGALNPQFASDVFAYTVEVANSVSTITLVPKAADSYASIKIAGVTGISGDSYPVALVEGTNTVPVEVTAEDGKTVLIYTLTINRATSGGVDKTDLNAKVAEAGAIVHGGKYTTTTWEAFTTALAAAKGILGDAAATQAQVDAALSTLSSALDALFADDSSHYFISDSHVKGTESDLIHTSSHDYALHTGIVRIDGNLLTEGVDYSSAQGSTRITLRAAYLNTLSVGTHTLTVGFSGTIPNINASFTLLNTGSGVPSTGDGSLMALETALLLGIVGVFCLRAWRKRRTTTKT